MIGWHFFDKEDIERWLKAVTLFILSKERMGRYKLAEILGISEGKVRGFLKKLSEKKLVLARKAGCVITPEGRKELLRELKALCIKYLEQVHAPKLGSPTGWLMVIKGVGKRISNGMRERDLTVVGGARGCTCMVVMGGKVLVPFDKKERVLLEEVEPSLAKKLPPVLEEGDGIFYVFGDKWRSLKACLFLALSLKKKASI